LAARHLSSMTGGYSPRLPRRRQGYDRYCRLRWRQRHDRANGAGVVTGEGAVASTQAINFAGAGTLFLNQSAFASGTTDGLGVGDDIGLSVGPTAIGFSRGDKRTQIIGGSTFDLAITGAHSLSDFVIGTQSTSTDIELASFATRTRFATTGA
jgi:hypothetical protein